MIRSDPDYPRRLKKRLGMESPPFFFGCGNRSLLNRGGVAVVGSREATEDDLSFTSRLGVRMRPRYAGSDRPASGYADVVAARRSVAPRVVGEAIPLERVLAQRAGPRTQYVEPIDEAGEGADNGP